MQVQAGMTSTVDILQLLPSYVNETSCAVWQSLIGSLSTIDRIISHTGSYEKFKNFAVKLFAPAGLRLGWDPKEAECKN